MLVRPVADLARRRSVRLPLSLALAPLLALSLPRAKLRPDGSFTVTSLSRLPPALRLAAVLRVGDLPARPLSEAEPAGRGVLALPGGGFGPVLGQPFTVGVIVTVFVAPL